MRRALKTRTSTRPRAGAGSLDLLGDRLDIEELAGVPLMPDKAPANGSTIAVLAAYVTATARAACLAGDAHPDASRTASGGSAETGASIASPSTRSRFRTTAAGSTSRRARSTSSRPIAICSRRTGSQTEHPHLEGVARTIARGSEPTLYFNYRLDFTEPLGRPATTAKARFQVHGGLPRGGRSSSSISDAYRRVS